VCPALAAAIKQIVRCSELAVYGRHCPRAARKL
jgi:hypothetical protein